MEETWDIAFENLSVGYGTRTILNNVSTLLPAGKINLLLGGSGSGKSTLLRHILGIMQPLSGRVTINGKDINRLPKKEFTRMRRRMGVLFQDGALLGSFSLFENIALPLREHTKLSEEIIQKIVNHKLALVGLKDFGSFFPNELSGGMRKRAGLARALVMNPKILLCDEPTSGLDPLNSAQMDKLIREMASMFPAMTIIVVTHDLHSLEHIADNIVMLNDKKMVFAGTFEAMKQSTDSYIQNFLKRDPPDEAKENIALEPDVQAALNEWIHT